MGLQQHRTLVAYTYDREKHIEAAAKIAEIWKALGFKECPEYIGVLGVGANSGGSIVIGPDGSKEGWPQADLAKDLRKRFWSWLETQKVGWSYAQIEFGELGNKSTFGR